jgi:hypothetical protein
MAPSPPRLRILSGEHTFDDPTLSCIEQLPSAPRWIFWLSLFLYYSFSTPSALPEMNRELRRCCIVGGNAVSAFLSWRLQATNACDVTLVWKANYQAVAQYGISFK